MRICREQSKYGRVGKGNIVKNEIKPSAMSYEFEINYDCGMESCGFIEEVEAMMNHFLTAIEKDGCSLIGHIKLVLDAGDDGLVMGSVTSFGKKVRWKGSLKPLTGKLSMLLNVIVYGMSDEAIDGRVSENFQFGDRIQVSQ